jgi:hypothetical protein
MKTDIEKTATREKMSSCFMIVTFFSRKGSKRNDNRVEKIALLDKVATIKPKSINSVDLFVKSFSLKRKKFKKNTHIA